MNTNTQIIRGATADDLKPACLMLWESYDYVRNNEDKDFFYHMIANEPEFQPEQLRIICIDDRIAATVLVAKRRMFDGKDILGLGGIGDVAVHPDFRGRGLAVLLLQDAVDYMIDCGMHVSTLYTGHVGLYEKLGFEWQSRRASISGRVPGKPSPLRKTKDWGLAETLFNSGVSKRPGAMVRSHVFWESYITGRFLRTADIVYSRDNTAYTMIVDTGEPESALIIDAGYSESVDQLSELLRTGFAGMTLNTVALDEDNPLLIAMNSVLESSFVSSRDIMARSLCEKPIPDRFLDMRVDRF